MRDEDMIAWKGQLIFKVYMLDKPYRYGIKAYLVCGSKNGYICNMEVYTGKSWPVKNLVLELLDAQLLNKGYYLFQDSYYNSAELSEMLLGKNTYVCGTLGLDRGVPKEMKEKIKYLKTGESTYCHKGQVLVQVW
jgi:hypothetical protein